MVRASEGTVRTANQEDHFRQVQWFNEEGQGLALNSIPMNCSQGCPKMPRKRYQPTIVAAVAVWGVGARFAHIEASGFVCREVYCTCHKQRMRWCEKGSDKVPIGAMSS